MSEKVDHDVSIHNLYLGLIIASICV